MPTTRTVILFVPAALLMLVAAACGGDRSENPGAPGGPGGGIAQATAVAKETSLQDNAFSTTTQSDAYAPTDESRTGQARPPATGTSTDSATAPNDPVAGVPSSLDRKIIFNARLDLTADDVPGSFSEVGRIARTAGGFIEKSSLSTRKDDEGKERPYASLTLRVPVDSYQDVLARLRTLPGGKVGKEDSASREVTDQYTDLQSRQRNLERSEAQYLKLLEQAKTIQEILTVNERLDGIRLQIERIQGQLNVLDHLADLATIDVSLAPVLPGKAQPKTEGPKSPADAFADAWQWGLDAAGYVVAGAAAAAAIAIWVAIPGVLVLGGSQLVRRRKPGTAI